LQSCPDKLEQLLNGLKGLAYPGFEQNCSAANYCQTQLPLFFTFFDLIHQCQAMSEFCVEPFWYGEQPNAIARQPWISAT
jgi:hypothetical protein